MSVQKLGYDALKSYVGVMAMAKLEIAPKLGLQNSLLGKSVTSGVLYATLSDSINYFSGQRSKFANGDFMGLVDDSLFFTGLSGVSRITGSDRAVYNMIKGVSPLEPQNNLILLETAIVTGGRYLGDYIDATPQAPEFLKKMRKPTKIFM